MNHRDDLIIDGWLTPDFVKPRAAGATSTSSPIGTQSFFSSRPNWDSPTPSHAGECVPPLWFRGGGYYTIAWGRGGPDSDEGTDTVVL
jgi:hypothetical protein